VSTYELISSPLNEVTVKSEEYVLPPLQMERGTKGVRKSEIWIDVCWIRHLIQTIIPLCPFLN